MCGSYANFQGEGSFADSARVKPVPHTRSPVASIQIPKNEGYLLDILLRDWHIAAHNRLRAAHSNTQRGRGFGEDEDYSDTSDPVHSVLYFSRQTEWGKRKPIEASRR